jgi:hypothetical protein
MLELNVLQDCRTVELSQGKIALVDAADFGLIAHMTWHSTKKARGLFYAIHTFCKNNKHGIIRLHRFLMAAPPGSKVDHRDGDGLNNTRENLRVCTHSQNHRNRWRTWGSSRFKGVFHRRENDKWRAKIKVGDKVISLGTFAQESDAARAYDKAATEHFGEFARTNSDIFGEY